MRLEDILNEFQGEEGEAAKSREWKKRFDELCQEAIRLGMELNCQYQMYLSISAVIFRIRAVLPSGMAL